MQTFKLIEAHFGEKSSSPSPISLVKTASVEENINEALTREENNCKGNQFTPTRSPMNFINIEDVNIPIDKDSDA